MGAAFTGMRAHTLSEARRGTHSRPRRAHGTCRSVFLCYPKSGAISRLWTCPPIDPSEIMSSHTSRLTNFTSIRRCVRVHACESGSHLKSYRLQWNVRLITVTFYKNSSACWGSRTVGLLGTSSMEVFYHIWVMTATPLSWENPAIILWTKKPHLTFSRLEGEWIMTEFSFWGELSL